MIYIPDDTTPEVAKRQYDMWMEKTPSERIKAAAAMAKAMREVVWGSLPDNLSEEEKVAAFYERLYDEKCPEGFLEHRRKWLARQKSENE